MAVVEFTNGHKRIISAAMGARIWRILNDEVTPTDAEERYCLRVKGVYLSRVNAPQSYLARYAHLFPDQQPVSRGFHFVPLETRKDLV